MSILNCLEALRFQASQRPCPVPYQTTALNLLEPIFLAQSPRQASRAINTATRKLSSFDTIKSHCRINIDQYLYSGSGSPTAAAADLYTYTYHSLRELFDPDLASQDRVEAFLFGFWTTFLDLVSATPHDCAAQDHAMAFVDELRKKKGVGTVEIAGAFTGFSHVVSSSHF